MALKKWIGTTGSSPTVAANWAGGVAPVAGDDIYIELTANFDYAPVGDATSLGLMNSVTIFKTSGAPNIGSSSSPFKFYCRGAVKIQAQDSTATTDYVHVAANTVSSPGLTIYPDQLYVKVGLLSSLYFYGPAGSLSTDEAYIEVDRDAKFYWENKIGGEVAGTLGKIYVNNGTGGEINIGPWSSGALTPALVEMGSQGYNAVDFKLAAINTVRVLGYEAASASGLTNKVSFSNPDTGAPTLQLSVAQVSKLTAASTQVVVNSLEAYGNKSLTPDASNARVLVNTGVRFDHIKLSGSAQLKFNGGILASEVRNGVIRPNHITPVGGYGQLPLIDSTSISAGQLSIPNYGETAATATFTFGDTEFDDHADETITLIDAAGTSKTYKIKASSPNASNQEFEDGANASAAATNFKTIVESANGHNGTLTVTANASAGKVVIAQATKGVVGNTAITHTSNWDAICDVNPPDFFSGGEASGGVQFQGSGYRNNIVPMVPQYSSIRLSWTDMNG